MLREAATMSMNSVMPPPIILNQLVKYVATKEKYINKYVNI
jgi:hypothetical protein